MLFIPSFEEMSLSFLSSVHSGALEPFSKDLSGIFELRMN
jgi:hypothetical protein